MMSTNNAFGKKGWTPDRIRNLIWQIKKLDQTDGHRSELAP